MSSQNDSSVDFDAQSATPGDVKFSEEGREQITKRRTKTGCLTCRKRRIKCGEERPICKNCIKSKRNCTGYSNPNSSRQHEHSNLDRVPGNAAGIESSWFNGGDTFQPHLSHSSSIQQPFYPHGVALSAGEHTAWDNQPTWTPPAMLSTYSAQVQQHASIVSDPTQNAQVVHDNHVGQQQFGILSNSSNIAHDQAYLEWSSTDSTIWRPSVSRTSSGLTPSQYNNLGFAQHSVLARHTPSISFNIGDITHVNEIEDPEDPWDVEPLDAYIQSNDRYQPSVSATHVQQQRKRGHSCLVLARNVSTAPSPLLEEKSQRIFGHFISVTGPCMSTFERHDHPFHNGLPKMLWTHELPAMAFHHAALAHAVLAVGAMHMSKLGLCGESVALKHFTYACRRIGKSLGDSQARLEVSTLATVLLLGYYEVMGGDHSRWSLHLSGAAKLIMEHNYATILKSVRLTRMQHKADVVQTWMQRESNLSAEYLTGDPLSHLLNDDCWKASEQSVSKLMGSLVDYDNQVQPNFGWDVPTPQIDGRKIQNWITLMELYWWFCKQDIYQGMLSGEPLLLPYREWKYCPPRGPINNIDKANATIDHLWILIARLTDFAGMDRKRKQQVVEAQGGQWIPAPGFLEFRPKQTSRPSPARPSANEGRARTAKQNVGQPPSQQPSFYGMIPPSANATQISSSFEAMNAQLRTEDNQQDKTSPRSSGTSLDQQTQAALAEHASISEAFDYFESCLGADFRPLLSDDIQITTPFGSAMRYRTPTIAAMWTFFLLGKIVLRRAHPYSPPAAMMSASVNAAFTKEDAQLVGRICGGLFAQHTYLLQTGHVDHLLSAAVMEVTFPLLFAAVQFQDPIQRGWTIGKLSEIAQETGWQSSAAVAAACETTWETMGLSGRGPPYERTMDQRNTDARVNGEYRYVYGHSPRTTPSKTQHADVASRFISHDRDLIDSQANARVHWALGILSVEEDLKRISLNERNPSEEP